LCLSVVILASCTSDPKPAPTAQAPREQTKVTAEKGIAGGVVEDVFIAQAVVSAVDVPTRRVTLTGPEGGQFTFTAGPGVKNLAQVRVGDKVTATFAQRMVVTVRSDEAQPSLARSTTQATARPGEIGIDRVNRTAELQFADGVVKTVPVRADVDLSRYNVGDNVIIRATTALTVLVDSM
jgi:hypothetical protein